MVRTHVRCVRFLLLLTLAACHGAADASVTCDAGRDCTTSPSAAVGGCTMIGASCVTLTSTDCQSVTGPASDSHAIVIGSLLSTQGLAAETNLTRQQSAMLAVEQINASGGIPSADGGHRSLVMVSCDASTDLLRAGKHLVNDLQVSAILGPGTSQDVLDLTQKLTIAAGTLSLSPTALAATIGDLADNDLSWTMVPSDLRRAPLMIEQINALEQQLRSERSRDRLKLGIVFRNDALGTSTRASLNTLMFNHASLADPVNLNAQVRFDPYDMASDDQTDLVERYVAFAPDIIVLIGADEVITRIIAPLEQRWASKQPGVARPQYLLTDSSKVSGLLQLSQTNPELSRRMRGVGVTPSAAASAVYAAFQASYAARFPGADANVSGASSSYDGVQSLADALSVSNATRGIEVARDLRALSTGGSTADASDAAMSGVDMSSVRQRLVAGEHVTALGTLGPLGWNADGSILDGEIEVWCVGWSDDHPKFASSGLTFDLAAQRMYGSFAPCAALGGGDQDDEDAGAAVSPPLAAGRSSSSSPMTHDAGVRDAAGRDASMHDAGSVTQPDAASQPVDSGISAQYFPSNTQPTDSIISPELQVTNVHVAEGVPLSRLAIRYYFSNEQESQCPVSCEVDGYYAGIQPSGVSVQALRRWVSGANGADYLEVTFGANSPTLMPGESATTQQSLHTNPYSDFNERNDYSFDASRRAFADSTKITVYEAGVLVWGTPPT